MLEDRRSKLGKNAMDSSNDGLHIKVFALPTPWSIPNCSIVCIATARSTVGLSSHCDTRCNWDWNRPPGRTVVLATTRKDTGGLSTHTGKMTGLARSLIPTRGRNCAASRCVRSGRPGRGSHDAEGNRGPLHQEGPPRTVIFATRGQAGVDQAEQEAGEIGGAG
jgi:hypothetical protein